MNKIVRDFRSIKVWLMVFTCAALWFKKLTGMEYAASIGVLVGSRLINERRFEDKDSA